MGKGTLLPTLYNSNEKYFSQFFLPFCNNPKERCFLIFLLNFFFFFFFYKWKKKLTFCSHGLIEKGEGGNEHKKDQNKMGVQRDHSLGTRIEWERVTTFPFQIWNVRTFSKDGAHISHFIRPQIF
ncbi:hypothetical protein POVWA2_006350 [Plasmodium ovale wallikeri]|uniref:Uncharacterized protein n=1 Tax=Plasmodium ovale wallikeri TaxID=864142 RepID=A0A1A8YI47_PLAOA|nr:hypothetical protein POVWA1_006130 [Plasmodium ovale wallikeri]SBT31825.1 hypothetical protein POVWA2_006350 [Plasmodium ovale wallikeri]